MDSDLKIKRPEQTGYSYATILMALGLLPVSESLFYLLQIKHAVGSAHNVAVSSFSYITLFLWFILQLWAV
jgi:hypothetical protein